MNIDLIRKEVIGKIEKAQDLKELDEIWRDYLGKEGEISRAFKYLKGLHEEKRKKIGRDINEAKKELEKIIEEKRKLLSKIQHLKSKIKPLDITLPGKKIKIGHLHPLSQIIYKIEDILGKMGFQVLEGPEVENEWYNFDALNFPEDHPAREAQDTLYIKQNKREKLPNREKLMMRTHTSPVQVRYMEKNNPPLRIIVPGRVFRSEATDASHEVQFYQLEGLMVDKYISLAHLKGVLENFMKIYFGTDVILRWQPSYFPFVEPGLELLMRCSVCKGKGCSTCGGKGWIEVIPCGMVHPNVFKAAGYNPRDWQGFAFGMGVDRLAMMKYKINDIRLFYSGDLKFLEQF